MEFIIPAHYCQKMGIIFDYVSFLFFFYVSTHKEFSNVLVSYPVSFLISIEYFSLHDIMQVKLYFHLHLIGGIHKRRQQFL